MDRRLALVTGASAGIGMAFAHLLAAQGYDLALTARRGDRLEALAADLRARHGACALVFCADMAEAATPAALAEWLTREGRPVDALINNAGYGLPGDFAQSAWEDQAAVLQVMLNGPCELAHRLLPGMIDRGFGRIVNVASVAGLTPGGAEHTLYGPVKSFMVRFSQSLHQETRGTGVHVSALCPGLTWSEFHDVNGTRDRLSAGTPRWLWMEAEAVAVAGWRAVEANRAVAVPGAPNRIAVALAKLVPDEAIMALMASEGWRARSR